MTHLLIFIFSVIVTESSTRQKVNMYSISKFQWEDKIIFKCWITKCPSVLFHYFQVHVLFCSLTFTIWANSQGSKITSKIYMFVHQCYICITLTPNFTFISHNISFREDKKSEKKYFPNVALKMVTMTYSGQQYYSFVRFTFFKIIYKINTYLYKLSLYTRYSEISYFQVNCRYSV